MTIQENRPADMTSGVGAIAPSVAQFSADALGLGYDTTLGQEPTIMVNVPVSRAMIEAACLNSTALQTDDNVPVTAERIASWDEDQVRSWALGEVLLMGAGAAMDTADYLTRPEQDLRSQELKDSLAAAAGQVHELIRERIGSAFGFEAAHDEARQNQVSQNQVSQMEAEPGVDERHEFVDVDQDDDDGWEL